MAAWWHPKDPCSVSPFMLGHLSFLGTCTPPTDNTEGEANARTASIFFRFPKSPPSHHIWTMGQDGNSMVDVVGSRGMGLQ